MIMKDGLAAAAKHDTLHLSIYEKAICHPSTKIQGDILDMKHASAVDDQDMTRADELRRLRSDVGGSPEIVKLLALLEGLAWLAVPFFWGWSF